MQTDADMVQRLFALSRKRPCATWQENQLIKAAAMRLDELTRARALGWIAAVKRGFRSEPAYVTGVTDSHGLTHDGWVLLYSPHGDEEDTLYMIAGSDIVWHAEKDTPGVLIWSDAPTDEQVEREFERRAKEAAKTR